MPNNKDGPSKPETLILNTVYRSPESIFSFRPKPLNEITQTATVVLDTNVLLLPFRTGKESLDQIRKVYGKLIGEGRLAIPGQVAREFAKNRSERLKETYQQINRKRLGLTEAPYPLLENSQQYRELQKVEAELLPLLKKHTQAVERLLQEIKSWHWNDPVSALYQELFHDKVVVEPNIGSEQDIDSDLERRYLHDIPPGYKDKNKQDGGVGDYLIWKTILEIGRARSSDTVFVSADRKSDWWIQSEGGPLYPRFELIEEYRHATSGKNFHIIDFASLLRTFGATEKVVAEVESKEAAPVVPDELPSMVGHVRHSLVSAQGRAAVDAISNWLYATRGVNRLRLNQKTHNRFEIQAKTVKNKKLHFHVAHFGSAAPWDELHELALAVDHALRFGLEPEVIVSFSDEKFLRASESNLEAIVGLNPLVPTHVGTIQRNRFVLHEF